MLSLESSEGIARVTLDSPPLNVLTRAMLRELRALLQRVAQDRSTRVLLLQASGRHFSAGASVEEHLPPEYEEMIPDFGQAIQSVYAFPLPVVAVVQGRCLGGGFELVQAADVIIAADDASFGQPEIHLGVFAPAACMTLPRRAGRGLASELLFTGDPVDAATAARAGLVQQVVPVAELAAAATTFAQRISRHSAAALRAAKRALRSAQNAGGSMSGGLAAAEEVYVHELMQTRDANEGLRAFLEKRPPQWSHE